MNLYRCPACDRPLNHGISVKGGGESEHVLFCRNPSCKSAACFTGAAGEGVEAAFKNLNTEYDKETEQKVSER